MHNVYEEQAILSEQQKTVIREMAKTAGLSIDDFLFQAALALKSEEERQDLTALFKQVKQSAIRIADSIDNTIAYIDASNKRIEEMERKARQELSWAY